MMQQRILKSGFLLCALGGVLAGCAGCGSKPSATEQAQNKPSEADMRKTYDNMKSPSQGSPAPGR